MKKTIAIMLLLGAGLMCRPVYADHPCCGITIDPAPADTNVQCIADVPSASASDVSAQDDCGNALSVNFSESSTGDDCNKTITRTWTATDDDCDSPDDTASVTQTVTVQDTTAPVVNAPADESVECIDDVPDAPDVTATDNCDGSISATLTETSSGDDCDKTITRTWKAVDACGNEGSDTQTITVHDTTAPVVNAPADESVECIDDVPDAPDVTATDNCDGSISATLTETSSGDD